jgi:hypothetical protein
VWNYDAAFAAHALLWAGERDQALSTFTGFLNHAAPLLCWREEQPLRGALVGNYVGDMPHNWASAECVLFLRHMLALEDGESLRLLAGIGAEELSAGEPYSISNSPTRFGRIALRLEPLDGMRGWHLRFSRDAGPAASAVELPSELAGAPVVTAAGIRRQGSSVFVDPQLQEWEVTWKRK